MKFMFGKKTDTKCHMSAVEEGVKVYVSLMASWD